MVQNSTNHHHPFYLSKLQKQVLSQDQRQWPRVVSQLSRLIGLLDDDGYAVLRTPWPFLHERDPARPDRDETERFGEVSLDIEGAIGPETHAYGTTAIHLYMRKPAEPTQDDDQDQSS